MAMKLFTIHIDGVSFRHTAPTIAQAEEKARQLAKRLRMETFSIFEHKMTRVI